ncbi:DUF3459 domain-containing protein, partial [Micromonospora sp. H61]|uniref:DUF3459 domain-containing protein n=1 Tax=Micromonospora sp. H61 TaxID=2824888 RepID=UPI001B38BB08
RRSRPDLSDPRLNAVTVQHGDLFLEMRRGDTLVVANVAGRGLGGSLPGVARRVLLATGEGVTVMRDRIQLPAETAAIVAL